MIHNENVCVVGGAGFLGSHMVKLLCGNGCRVVVVDNLTIGRKEWVNYPGVRFYHHDITGSEEYLVNILKGHCTRYLFNYAAYPYIPDSFARPLHVFNVNAFGALKVINAAHIAGVERILQVSSAEIYGSHPILDDYEGYTTDPRISEDYPITPHSTYGASKAAIDFLIQARVKEAGVPVISLRQFNCVGERETHPYVVPEIIDQLTRGWITGKRDYPPTVYLGNNSKRDFMYAGDAVSMASELLLRGELGEVYNMGSESAVHIYDLATLIAQVMNLNDPVAVVQDAGRVRPWEIWHLQSNNAKLYSAIRSRPKTLLMDALAKAYDWYAMNNHKWPWE